MGLRNIFYKLANDVNKYPNIVQLCKTLDHGFKEVSEHINDGGSEVVVTPLLTSGKKIATISVDGDDSDIYAPGLEYGTTTDSFNTVNGSLVDELKVGMVPVQAGSGTPSPTNPRAISGHTEAKAQINDTVYTTSLGTTVYGGELDMVSGDGENAWSSVDLGSLTWTYTSGRFRSTDAPTNIKVESSIRSADGLMVEIYNPSTEGEDESIFKGNTGQIYIYDSRYTDAATFTTAMSGITLYYKVATPTTLTLTGQNITAEVGENNVSAPMTGQSIVEVKYHTMMTIDDVIKLTS